MTHSPFGEPSFSLGVDDVNLAQTPKGWKPETSQSQKPNTNPKSSTHKSKPRIFALEKVSFQTRNRKCLPIRPQRVSETSEGLSGLLWLWVKERLSGNYRSSWGFESDEVKRLCGLDPISQFKIRERMSPLKQTLLSTFFSPSWWVALS